MRSRHRDTSFLIDYLDGAADAEDWLADNEREPVHAPTVGLFEVYRGVLRADLPRGLDGAVDALEWTEPFAFTASAAREAARIEAELHATGERIGVADRQIAGIARDAGATLVTRDDHFRRVDGLDVVRYDT